jgi:TonB family protein
VRGVTSVHPNASVKPASPPVGEWQHARIEAEANVLRITLNDAPPLTFEELDEYAGYVALHAERGRVAFRNIRITRIPPHEQQFESGIFRESAPGVRSPKLVREVKPFYPKEPHDAWIQGKVMLEAVVQEDGSVGDVRVTAPKHADLDQAAVAAVRKWQFAPAQKDGQAIPLIVSIEMTFTRTR